MKAMSPREYFEPIMAGTNKVYWIPFLGSEPDHEIQMDGRLAYEMAMGYQFGSMFKVVGSAFTNTVRVIKAQQIETYNNPNWINLTP
jgi:hypothetical protein